MSSEKREDQHKISISKSYIGLTFFQKGSTQNETELNLNSNFKTRATFKKVIN